MPLSRSRQLIYGTAIAVGLLGGSTAIAVAATSSTDNGTTNNPAYTSSVTAPDTENEQGIARLATTTADQARQAATAATGGTAQQAQLENENGNVVYSVVVTLPDGKQLDVKVDAGNAKVLAHEAGDQHEAGDSGAEDRGKTGAEQGTNEADGPAAENANG